MSYYVDPDITRASTLPGRFYADQEVFDFSKDQVFTRSWQVIDGKEQENSKSNVLPYTLLPGFLDEPLMLVGDSSGRLRCFSNVCTHRGNILIGTEGKYSRIVCGYHGRCFDLNGQMTSMPGFEGVKDFPSDRDHLKEFNLTYLGPIPFVSLSDEVDQRHLEPLRKRMHWFPFDSLQMEESLCRDYLLDAHWALYCENYLEGFHIPFVHHELNKKLEFSGYHLDLYPRCNVQIGIAGPDEDFFSLPTDHPDHGQRIYAYYWWIFPNVMVNIYNWGISLNVVKPRCIDKTEISFRTYLLPGIDREKVHSTGLHETEMEDEMIVLNVQKGVRARGYDKGRFSVAMEQGVHHFQRLMVQYLNQQV